MTNYIEITSDMSDLINQINFNLSEIEVKGESVKYLFNSRMLIKQLLENSISKEDILKKGEKEADR